MSGKTRNFVPGGPWSGVTLKMENRSDTALKDVVVRLAKLAYDEVPDAPLEQQQYVNIQRWDADSRTWAEIPWSESEMVGSLPSVDLAAHKTAAVALRMSVEADWPHGRFPDFEDKYIGSGWLEPMPTGISDEGVCGYGENWSFVIAKPGTGTGEGDGDGATSTPTSTPTSGTGGGNTPSPQTGSSTAPVTSDTTPTGDLAHTGSSSALPVIAGVGGAAVALGAGAVYVVRRRRSGTGTHA
ncbi:LAETG motif-containing sortase-dependent surface protein [Streptomyces sp. NPDC002156]